MTDQMVLQTQQWLNKTYGNDPRFKKINPDGRTGWPTIYALTRALQIELGIQSTADNFGPSTQRLFKKRYPNGVRQQAVADKSTSNVYSIIQGALWCKGYSTGGNISQHFYDGTGSAIRKLKTDMGIEGDSSVDVEIMGALLSMKQFVLLASYGGIDSVRRAQQFINKAYRPYTGIIPTDGLYGREMNTALIQVLQSLEGFSPSEATGNFGNGTRSRLKTITANNASSNESWVWLASTALACNGIGGEPTFVWTSTFANIVKAFQERYAIAVTGSIDSTTWMSLLTSKGDPDRPCVACDTRFEITDARLATLKADGYEIVGRYLTEPGQSSLAPKDYFKAIRPGELERITKGGMKFFPIFQEYSTKLEHFTPANGAAHARAACEAAQRLGIPPTHIYFAVDFDATDDQVTSNILPYFRAVLANLGGGYKVGIYASRNICSRVIEAGQAGYAFVSDMSTGFSGNLGFPIPDGWVYDQFTEIDDYKGQGWDLDRVAYSGKMEAVSYVRRTSAGGAGIDQGTDYSQMSPLDLVWHLEKRFEELRSQGRVGKDYVSTGSTGTWVTVPTWRCMLNYMSKDYLRDGGTGSALKWSISAESFRASDAKVLESDAKASSIIKSLDRYIAGWRQSMTDVSGEQVDLAHMCVTTLGYLNGLLIPDAWTGWAGDLASAMGNVKTVMEWNPGADLAAVCEALVGQGDDYRSHPGIRNLVLGKEQGGVWKTIGNSCNRDDLCCDGDAIYFADKFQQSRGGDAHLLSSMMRAYYNDSSLLSDRFKRIARSVGAATRSEAAKAFYANEDWGAGAMQLLLNHELIENKYVSAACQALANFIY